MCSFKDRQLKIHFVNELLLKKVKIIFRLWVTLIQPNHPPIIRPSSIYPLNPETRRLAGRRFHQWGTAGRRRFRVPRTLYPLTSLTRLTQLSHIAYYTWCNLSTYYTRCNLSAARVSNPLGWNHTCYASTYNIYFLHRVTWYESYIICKVMMPGNR